MVIGSIEKDRVADVGLQFGIFGGQAVAFDEQFGGAWQSFPTKTMSSEDAEDGVSCSDV